MTRVDCTATDVVRQFNTCISKRDLDALSDMVTEDHVFIDSAGHTISGKHACMMAWEGFFAAFPDYRNEFALIEEKDGFVAVSGRSVCSDVRLQGPALWKAVVLVNRVAEWHVLDSNAENMALLGLCK